MNYNKSYLPVFLISFAYLSWVYLVTITHIFPGVLYLICCYSWQRTLSRYYIQRGAKNVNYAKKRIIFFHANFLNKENKIKMNKRISPSIFNKKDIEYVFYVFSFPEFGHHAETCNLIPNMISDWKMSPILLARFCC